MNLCPCYYYIAMIIPSQDTLFLPDDSFLSLYRVFGVTEVFNEVPGDYFMIISLCSTGVLRCFHSTALETIIECSYYPSECFTALLWQITFQETLLRAKALFFPPLDDISEVFNETLSMFVCTYFSLPGHLGLLALSFST